MLHRNILCGNKTKIDETPVITETVEEPAQMISLSSLEMLLEETSKVTPASVKVKT